MYPSKTQAVATAIYGFDSAKIGILFQTTNNFAVKKRHRPQPHQYFGQKATNITAVIHFFCNFAAGF